MTQRGPVAAPAIERYVKEAPSHQNALDIFAGEWSSKLPPPFAELRAGSIPLFEDPRVEWACDELGGVSGLRVLELGPLEAAHTYMLEKRGAESILSIEANAVAFLRCLVVKEITGLRRSRFRCGDFVEFLRHNDEKFDFCLASGVLYHMINPVEVLHLIAATARSICLWTHYHEEALIAAKPEIAAKFAGEAAADHAGFRHTLHRYEYGAALDWGGFSGGSAPYSHWLSRGDILRCLEFLGFDDIKVNFEDPDHTNGPSFSVLARRGGG